MLAIASLLVVFSLSVLLVRIGAHALNMTGLGLEPARFQALSALSNTGFTTTESEHAVSTPARRRITTLLIRAGSLGIVTGVSTLVLSFVDTETGGPAFWRRLGLLLAGSAGIYALSHSAAFDRVLTRLIRGYLRDYTELDLADYAHLLHLTGDYRITEVTIAEDSYLTRGPLRHLALQAEGVLVLGVDRGGDYHGAPGPDVELRVGDRVTLYGRRERLLELRGRASDDEGAHAQAVDDQRGVHHRERAELAR